MFFQTLLHWMAYVGKTLMGTLSCSVASCVTDFFYSNLNFFSFCIGKSYSFQDLKLSIKMIFLKT